MRALLTGYSAFMATFISSFAAAGKTATHMVDGESYKGYCFGGAAVLEMERSSESLEFLDETL